MSRARAKRERELRAEVFAAGLYPDPRILPPPAPLVTAPWWRKTLRWLFTPYFSPFAMVLGYVGGRIAEEAFR